MNRDTHLTEQSQRIEKEESKNKFLPYAARERHKVASLRVQAVFRGNKGRRTALQLKATRMIQAQVRGWRVRRHLDQVVFGWAAYDHAVTVLKTYCQEKNKTMHELFDEFDIDKDQSITIEEVQQFFIEHPAIDLDKDEIQALAYHLDHNQNHVVDLKEFVHSMQNHEKKLRNIQLRWEKHQKLKRRRASDYERIQMRRDRQHVLELQTKADASNMNLRLNLARMSQFRKLVSKHREDHLENKIRKQKRLLDGHLTYRQEAKIKYKRHHSKIRRAKAQAMDALRVANMNAHAGGEGSDSDSDRNGRYGIRSNGHNNGTGNYGNYGRPFVSPIQTSPTHSTHSTHSTPNSPKGRPQQNKSPRNRKMHLSNIQRKSKTWKQIKGDDDQVFYQNIVTHEVEWEMPPQGILYDPKVKHHPGMGNTAFTPDFETIFDTLPSNKWRGREKQGKPNRDQWNMSGEELEKISNGVLEISSLRFAQDTFVASSSGSRKMKKNSCSAEN